MSRKPFDLVIIGGGIVGSFMASLAVKRGLRTAVVDIGPRSLSDVRPPTPALLFPGRAHVGCIAARNHVLGGNGSYWGGGLMRPPTPTFGGCVGLAETGSEGAEFDMTPHFFSVERVLGIGQPKERRPAVIGGVHLEGVEEAEIGVLRGKKRNVSEAWIDAVCQSAHGSILSSAQIQGFDAGKTQGGARRVRSVIVRHDGRDIELVGERFIIAAGVVDSNLLVQRFADQLTSSLAERRLGRGLHDHWSVPIAEVDISRDASFVGHIAPQFRDGLLIGRHYEIESGAAQYGRGFLHFTFAFDDQSPYREIKHLMALRQQRAPLSHIAREMLPLSMQTPAILKIGLERLLRGRLKVGKDVKIRMVIDFESCPHVDNAIRLEGSGAVLDWDVRYEDEHAFLSLMKRAKSSLEELGRRFRLEIRPLFTLSDDASSIAHLHSAAVDAYHLGGGLPAGTGATPLDVRLRLQGSENVSVLSTAAFARAGVVNPTHALLALADRLVGQAS